MALTVGSLVNCLNTVGVGKNQNAFARVKVGEQVLAADSEQDVLSIEAGGALVGSGDSATKKITFSVDSTAVGGRLALFDGYLSSSTEGCTLVDQEIGWFSKASMPTARNGLTSSVIDNILYAVGGNDGSYYLSTNEAYDPATDSWTTKASMPTARSTHTASVIGNILYVVGGYNGASLSTNEAYDPTTNSWTAKASMPTARYHLTSSVIDNILYVVGGWNGSSPYFSTNEAYNPDTNTWTTKANMLTSRKGLISSVINNILYAVGGYDSVSFLSTNEAYDPTTNSWTAKASMPTARYAFTSSVINNILYAMGGDNGSQLSTNEAYDPTTNSWTAKANMLTARSYLASSVIDNILYAVGGNDGSSRISTNEAYIPVVYNIVLTSDLGPSIISLVACDDGIEIEIDRGSGLGVITLTQADVGKTVPCVSASVSCSYLPGVARRLAVVS
ncbi:MAG: kelch repeat-containing protein [Bacillota bacterium]